MIQIDSIDHIVLTVRDIEATLRFYTQGLGMRAETFGDGRHALNFGQQKFNLHQAGAEFEPKARTPTPGSADFCLITRTPLDAVVRHLQTCGLSIESGPVPRTGALGPLQSIYLRDPDDNLVEIANQVSDRVSNRVGNDDPGG